MSERHEPQALADNGWNFFDKCNCQRTLKYIYIHPEKSGLFLEWYVKSHQFRILNGNLTKVSLTPLSRMDAILKSL